MKRSSKSAGGTKKKSAGKTKSAPRRRGSGRGKWFLVIAVVLVGAFVGYRYMSATGASKKPTATHVVETEAKSEDAAPSLDRIVGRWTRLNGTARFEIRGIRDDGRLDAAYFNPNRVQIDTAAAKQERDYIRVYLKLQDPSEPGSTYRLNYDPMLDTMRGDYYDAVARQINDVVFTRAK